MAETKEEPEDIDLDLVIDEEEDGEACEKEDLDNVSELLRLNLQYQEKLKAHIRELDNVLQDNLAMQHDIWVSYAKKREIKYQNSAKCHRKPITLFAAPYFRDVKGFVPEKNIDAIEKEKAKEVDAYLGPLRPWTKREYSRLRFGVYENVKQRLVMPLKSKIGAIEQKLSREIFTEADEQKLLDVIEDFKEEIEAILETSTDELAERHKDEIDWLAVSSTYLSGTRKAEDCQAMWENYLSPTVNKKQFTDEEDEMLKEIVRQHGERDWELISLRLGTGRTAIQCLERYQSHHNPRISNIYWTIDEDEHLKRVVSRYLLGNYVPWHKVMSHVYGRTRMQVTNRWNRNLAPWLLSGDYCTDEDSLVVAAVQKYRKNWKKISEFIPWRSTCSIRERFSNFLDTDIVTGSWSLSEDLELLNQIAVLGEGKWSKICKAIPNRTDSMCNTRAIILRKHDAKLYKFLTSKQHSLLKDDPRYPNEQFAPSKQREGHNETRKCLRKKAIETYMTLYEALTGLVDVHNMAPYESDVITPSVKLLKSMRNYVLEHCPHRQYLEPVKPDYEFGEVRKKTTSVRREYSSDEEEFNLANDVPDPSSSSSESEIQPVSDDDVECTKEEEDEMKMKLDVMFAPLVAMGLRRPYGITKHVFNSVGKDYVQYQILQEIILEDFGLLTAREDVMDDEPYKVRNVTVDYRRTVPLMLRMFVMPETEPDTLPVVPPNNATMTATLMLLVNRREAKEDVGQLETNGTIHNIKAITADIKLDRACALCSWKKAGQPLETLPKKMICCCEMIQALRQRLMLMRKRFVCTFLIPFLMTEKPLSSEQVKSIFCDYNRGKRAYQRTPKIPKAGKRKRKKRRIKKKVKSDDSDDEDFEALCSQSPPAKVPQFINTRTRCVQWRGSRWTDMIVGAAACAEAMDDDEDEDFKPEVEDVAEDGGATAENS